jgi:outer membrane lipoprotein-sorting protein
VNRFSQHIKLHRLEILIGMGIGLVVAGVGWTIYAGIGRLAASSPPVNAAPASNGTQPPPILTVQSSPAEVVALMEKSQNQWQALDLTATIRWYGPQGDNSTVTTTVQIQQFAKARVHGQQTFAKDHPPLEWTWLSDGQVIYEQDNYRMIYTKHDLPPYAQSPHSAATAAATAATGNSVQRQPLAILMPTELGDYIYPSGLMQRYGTVTVEGADEIAGRPVIAIRWDSTGNPARYWVDAGTGLILGAETYGGDGPGGVFEETKVTRITYDQTLTPETFAFQPLAGAKFVTYDEWMGPAPK